MTLNRIQVAHLASIAALSFCGTLSKASGAAQTEFALDLDFVHPIAESDASSGGGGALRLGQQLDLIALSFTGEIGATYHSFGGDGDLALYSGIAGGRLSVGKLIEPGAFIHVGAGNLDTALGSTWVPLFDVGLFLEITVFPLLDIGVHGTYVHCFSNSETDTFEYFVIGPHAAMIF